MAAGTTGGTARGTNGGRRQVDRRAATTERLLDATIECLAEDGYVATTTRRVAERAGVSQGAQQHYFPTKAALVDAAMVRLVEQLLVDAGTRGLDVGTERERAGALLDLIWEIHHLPITPAVLELFNVARTEPALAQRVAEIVCGGMGEVQGIAAGALPSYAGRDGFADFVQIAMATVRGTVLVAAIPGAAGAHPTWPVLRAHLLESLERL
ncbi:TetR/AcrR family transcriptional regulator [Nocardioides carbamazepini]|uniref:TetR/AcrR family transcriptional regulator n=1 Tax=Nocardioides carbamazepini TaxID=2854259 RepID=UPI00214A8A60|nr:TetR/AcrR family transcriptional regulator [Nocardioides carbamazepini]MCR1783317.1 TetR/AcrR family transcriptional regulator [Nocardioides carbamazepini]